MVTTLGLVVFLSDRRALDPIETII